MAECLHHWQPRNVIQSHPTKPQVQIHPSFEQLNCTRKWQPLYITSCLKKRQHCTTSNQSIKVKKVHSVSYDDMINPQMPTSLVIMPMIVSSPPDEVKYSFDQCVSRGRRCPGVIESPLSQHHRTWNCVPQVHKNLRRYSITKPSATSDEKKKSERCPSMLELTDPDSRHADMKVGDVRGGDPN